MGIIKQLILWSVFMLSYLTVIGQSDKNEYALKRDTIVAGEIITLTFDSFEIKPEMVLHCHSALGSVVLSPLLQEKDIVYQLPNFMSQKAGQITWFLFSGSNQLKQGVFMVLPMQATVSMETYLGPPSILAGGVDYTMFVSIPTDEYDNTMLDSTVVNLEYYFKNRNVRIPLLTDKGYVFKRIFSPNKSGRIFAVSECLNTYSKEYDVNVQPALPIDFLIFAEEHHGYADGNQISTFKTSILVDTFNNIVSDGTMVEFYIKNNYGNILRTRGVTIKGIATAEMLHPEYEDRWSVQAIVAGMAESNVIEVDFKQVVLDYDVHFYDQNRRIVLGPIKSYMNQLIPDGFKADMAIFKHGKLVKREIKAFQDGMVTFLLDINEIEQGNYKICFKVADLNQVFEAVEL